MQRVAGDSEAIPRRAEMACVWHEGLMPTRDRGTSPFLTQALQGVLLLAAFISLLTIPAPCWLPPEIARDYCLQSFAAMSWLWLLLAPAVTLLIWLAERYAKRRRPSGLRSRR